MHRNWVRYATVEALGAVIFLDGLQRQILVNATNDFGVEEMFYGLAIAVVAPIVIFWMGRKNRQ